MDDVHIDRLLAASVQKAIEESYDRGATDQQIGETLLGQAASVAVQGDTTREVFLQLAGVWFDAMVELRSKKLI